MIDVTDRRFRMLIRCISQRRRSGPSGVGRAILYNAPSEPEYALNKNEPRKSVESLIGFSAEERPLVMQLGGAEPERLARGGARGAARVRRGQPELRLPGADARPRAQLLRRAADVRAAARRRLLRGDDRGGGRPLPRHRQVPPRRRRRDTYEELHEFVRVVAAVGVTHFIVHARKAILGLDTVKNRSVPPLRHEWVLRLMDDFPALKFTLNGGVTSLAAAAELLARGVHGVMIGAARAPTRTCTPPPRRYGHGGRGRAAAGARALHGVRDARAGGELGGGGPAGGGDAAAARTPRPLRQRQLECKVAAPAVRRDTGRARLASEPVAEIIRVPRHLRIDRRRLDARPSLPAPKPPPTTVEQAAAAAGPGPTARRPRDRPRERESPVTHTPPSAPALAWLASVQSLLGCGACVRGSHTVDS